VAGYPFVVVLTHMLKL